MSRDTVGEPERNNTPNSCQGQGVDDALTPEIREVLGNLALNAETHVELGEALAEANRMLTALVERHPEFDGSAAELRAKLAQLQDLHSEAGKEVMRYSHAYEDATMAGAKLNKE